MLSHLLNELYLGKNDGMGRKKIYTKRPLENPGSRGKGDVKEGVWCMYKE
jgi:hypothetical protein